MSLRNSFDAARFDFHTDVPVNDFVPDYSTIPTPPSSIADDEMVSFYKRSNNKIRKQLVVALNDEQEERLRAYYLNELDIAVTKMETEHHHSCGDARALYEEIKANKLSRAETFDALHTSIDLLNTPAASPDLPTRAEKFFDCMNEIRDKGKSNFKWGIGYAILAGLLIAGAVTVCALSLCKITPHITPGMAVAVSIMETIQSIHYAHKSHSIFKIASGQKAAANKMEALGNHLIAPSSTAPENSTAPRLK